MMDDEELLPFKYRGIFCNRKQLNLIYGEKKLHKTHLNCEMLNHTALEELGGFVGVVHSVMVLLLSFNIPRP